MTIDKIRKPKKQSWVPAVLIGIAIAYLFLVQYIPAINVFFEAFKRELDHFYLTWQNRNFSTQLG